MPVLYSPDQS